MENQAVRRRVNIIASHLGAHEDLSATATHLFPVSCSNSLNPAIRRCDSRMNFARQISSSQACFMRQAANKQEQDSYAQSGICSKSHEGPMFSRPSTMDPNVHKGLYSHEEPMFSRPSTMDPNVHKGLYSYEGPMFSRPSTMDPNVHKGLYSYEGPMFSRPSTMDPNVHNIGKLQYLQQAWNYHQHLANPPTFAQPSRSDPHHHSNERKEASNLNGYQWLPKMDVAESGCNYVITIELPGVNASNIRVEVNNQTLRITGDRSIDWRKVATCSTDSVSAYHKKEISQGPYKIVWPLPTNVNKNSISADYAEGILLITIPKV